MYVCMYVCVCVCMYVCMYVCPRCCIQLIALQGCSSCIPAFQFVSETHSNTKSKTDKIQGKHFHNPFQTLSFTTSSPFSLFLSVISYPLSKVCIIPLFCILEKSATCGVIRSYYLSEQWGSRIGQDKVGW